MSQQTPNVSLVSLSFPHRPRLLVLDDYEQAFALAPEMRALSQRAECRMVSEPLRGEALRSALAEAEILVLNRDRTPIGAAELDMAPKLRLIAYTGNRNGRLDQAACDARGIPVLTTEFGPSKAATCELTWALILAAFKRLEQGLPGARLGGEHWRQGLSYPGLCEVLEGETLGLLGLGGIGSKVAKVGQAFGMRVVCWSPNMTPERAAAAGVEALSLNGLLAESRVVSLHLVLGPSTQGLLGADAFARMRPDSLLVNTSRAGLINEPALLEALALGRPAMAALDVFEQEPLPAGHGFSSLPNVVLTPHLGFVARPVYEVFVKTIAQQLDGLLPPA